MHMKQIIRGWGWLTLTGLTLAGGCATSLQRNLDVLFSPSAFDSLLTAGQTAVLPLVRLLRWVF